MDKTYKVSTGGFDFNFTPEEIAAADLIQIAANSFNLLHDHRSVNASLVETDAAGKQAMIAVEGENFNVTIKDELDLVLEQMGFGKASAKQIKEIKAPMPGMVLEIAVTVGQEVKEGEKLLILGAMKMENSISIHADAIIKKVNVTAGQAVEKGQVLVELE